MIAMKEETKFDWRLLANCQDLGDLAEDNPFFVEGYGANYPVARTYCSSCRVVIDCLLECLVTDLNEDNEGMWGCMSPNERRTVIKLIHQDGLTIKKAAETIWARQRGRRKGSLVPPTSVWSQWHA